MTNKNPFDFQFEHIHLEISSKCALKCPRCPRTEHPETPWLSRQLGLDDVRKVLPADLLKERVRRVTICGDVGDPIYNTEFREILAYFKGVNPEIHLYIVTNGSYRSQSWWRDVAGLLNERDTVAFSVDGYDQESNERYRVGSNWESIMVGVDEIARSKAFLVWATIVFSFNEAHLDRIRALAKDRGCDYLQLTKSTKFGSVYGRFKPEAGADPLEPTSDWVSASQRFERTTLGLSDREIDNSAFMSAMIDRTKVVEESHVDALVFPLCKTGNRGLYINVTGQLFPCSWVSFPYDKTVSMKTGRTIGFQESFFNEYAERFNLLRRDFTEVIGDPLWAQLFGSFRDPKKCFIECEHKCRKEVMVPEYKVGWFLN